MPQYHNRIKTIVAIRPQAKESREESFRSLLQAVVEGRSDNIAAIAPVSTVIDTTISERWTLGEGGGNDD